MTETNVNLKDWTYKRIKDGIEISYYRGKDEVVVVPGSIDGVHVTEFHGSFPAGEQVKKIIFPDSIHTIKDTLLSPPYSSLSEIVWPKSLKNVEGFRGCACLTALNLPDTVTNISGFEGCSGLTELHLPPKLKELSLSFSKCTGLTELTLPEGMESIHAFFDCTGLRELNLPKSLKTLSGFENCKELKALALPLGLESISGFSQCTSLTTLNIPDGVTAVRGFDGCTGLTSVTLPRNLKLIDGFRGCAGLTAIALPAGLETLRGFDDCTALTSFSVPDSVTGINGNSYWSSFRNYHLPEIDLPQSLNSITFAFLGCKELTSLTLPANVKTIMSSFNSCPKLEKLTLLSVPLEVGDSFGNCKSIREIVFEQDAETMKKGSPIYNLLTNLMASNTSFTITAPEKSKVAAFAKKNNIALTGAQHKTAGHETPKQEQVSQNASANHVPANPDEWEYENVATGIAITQYKGKESHVVVPAEIGGNPVVEIQRLTGRFFDPWKKGFEGYTGISKVTLPDGLTHIGSSAFIYQYDLTEVDIPESLLAVGKWAFGNCKSLIKAKLPKNLLTIEGGAFKSCPNLKEFTIPLSARIIKNDHNGFTVFGSFEDNNPAKLTLIGKSGAMHTIETKRLRKIIGAGSDDDILYCMHEAGFFAGLGANTKMIAECVKMFIANDADDLLAILCDFGMIHAKRINEYIEYASTAGAAKSTALLLDWKNANVDIAEEQKKAEKKVDKQLNAAPPTAMQLSEAALRQDYHFLSAGNAELSIKYKGSESIVSIPSEYKGKNVTLIRKEAFARNITITKVILPDTIKEIGEEAFRDCKSLKEIAFPEGLERIAINAFWGCSALETVVLPNSMTSLPEFAFSQCGKLESVVLPEGLTNIGHSAFYQCVVLKEIDLSKVETIGTGAFNGCAKLESVKQPENMQIIPANLFNGCAGLKAFTIPASVTEIGFRAFAGCSALKTITIPDGVTSIGKWAFLKCTAMHEAVLPASLKDFGDGVFHNCTNLTIHAPAGSAAETYAKENNIPFVAADAAG